MGYYINPKGQKKEDWLLDHGAALSGPPIWDQLPRDVVPVCLVKEDTHTAAGICLDEQLFKDYSSEDDKRPKIWWIVRREDLIKEEFVTEEDFK